MYLTTGEAAEYARRHPVTIRRSLVSGELHGVQRVAGGRWLIRPECLEAWLEATKCQHKNVVDLSAARGRRPTGRSR